MDKNDGPVFLKAWREHRGLTMEQLAELVGTSSGQIAMLESGERGLSTKCARKLAAALETTPGTLLDYPPTESPANVVNIWSRASASERDRLERLAEASLDFKAG